MEIGDLINEVEHSYKFVAANIKMARRTRGLTQQQVADACGIGLTTYKAIENGDTASSAMVYGRVIVYFGLGVTIRMLAASNFDAIGLELNTKSKPKAKSKSTASSK